MSDPYAGLDLLADVFPGTETTETTPMPLWNWWLTTLWPAPDDPRWQVDAPLLSHVDSVRYGHVASVTPRAAETGKITKVTPGRLAVVREGVLGGLRRSQAAANGNGGEA